MGKGFQGIRGLERTMEGRRERERETTLKAVK